MKLTFQGGNRRIESMGAQTPLVLSPLTDAHVY